MRTLTIEKPEGDEQQDHGDGRGVPGVVELECLLPQVEDHRHAGVEDAAGPVGQDVDLVEDLERGQAGDDEHEDDLRPEPGQRHVAVLLPVVAAVDAGGVVQLLGDVLEAGQEDDGVVADARPDRQHHRQRQDQGGRRQPLDRLLDEPDRLEDAVDEPGPLEHPAPRQADGDGAGDRGDEVQGAEDAHTAQASVDDDGQPDRQEDEDRRHQQVDDRVGEREPERLVAEQLLVVLEPDQDRRGDDVEVGEAVVDDRPDRVQHEDPQQHQGRQQEQVRRGGQLAGHRSFTGYGPESRCPAAWGSGRGTDGR